MWVPLEDVLAELEPRLSSRPDYITLSGSGEPTLFLYLDELITRVKGMTSVPVALLTNGALLWQPEVRRAVRDVDLLIPSLDAGGEMMLRRVNRPHSAISWERLMEGLVAAREACQGKYWLEVLLVAGYTDSNAELEKLANCVHRIEPDLVQLNTVTRPPIEAFAEGISQERLAEAAGVFDAPVEVIVDHPDVHEQAHFSASRRQVLALLERRPCSIGDIAAGLRIHPNEVVKHVGLLHLEGVVETTWSAGKRYYTITSNQEQAGQRPGRAPRGT
jgi:wyosine [tRNA(Phe)-imidazoG37] synthetase (radical SAM superfamily)